MPITSKVRTNNSTDVSNGRYSQGGSTDRFPNRVGWWERVVLPKSSSDVTYTVTPRTALRPDLIAYDLYKTSELQWFILQYNNIVDVNEELTAGTKLILPTASRVTQTALNRPTGGNKV